MRHRIAALTGFIAATATLTVALAVAGFGPADTSVVNAVDVPTPTPRIQVDTIYVPPPVDPPTITVSRVIGSGGESEDESEHGGDD